MPEEACALVCFLMSMICAVLSWYSLIEGEMDYMVPVIVFGAISIAVATYALAHKVM